MDDCPVVLTRKDVHHAMKNADRRLIDVLSETKMSILALFVSLKTDRELQRTFRDEDIHLFWKLQ
jgi:hypothetical protein